MSGEGQMLNLKCSELDIGGRETWDLLSSTFLFLNKLATGVMTQRSRDHPSVRKMSKAQQLQLPIQQLQLQQQHGMTKQHSKTKNKL